MKKKQDMNARNFVVSQRMQKMRSNCVSVMTPWYMANPKRMPAQETSFLHDSLVVNPLDFSTE